MSGGLAAFNGVNPNGAWTYFINNNGASSGTINNVSLSFLGPGTSLADLTAECSVTINTPETATDNCNGSINGTASIAGVPQTIPFTISTQGTTVIDWTFTDGTNSTTVQQNVIIDDVTAPIADVDPLPDATGQCSVTPTAPTATDVCEGTITGTTGTTFPITTQGTTVITWTYDDGNGNSSTQTQNVVVDDTTPPVASCMNIILPLDATGNASIVPSDVNNGSSDNCGTVNFSFMLGDQTAYDCFDVGNPVMVTLIVDDGNGNSSTCTATVTADDVTPPVADVDPLPNATGECSVTVTAPTATDVSQELPPILLSIIHKEHLILPGLMMMEMETHQHKHKP
jgi:hypothetical protein